MPRPKHTAQSVPEVLLGNKSVPTQPVRTPEVTKAPTIEPSRSQSMWLTPKEAADWARCGVKTIYREVNAGRLRAARVGGRRELRIKPEWVDEWLEATAAAIEVAA